MAEGNNPKTTAFEVAGRKCGQNLSFGQEYQGRNGVLYRISLDNQSTYITRYLCFRGCDGERNPESIHYFSGADLSTFKTTTTTSMISTTGDDEREKLNGVSLGSSWQKIEYETRMSTQRYNLSMAFWKWSGWR